MHSSIIHRVAGRRTDAVSARARFTLLALGVLLLAAFAMPSSASAEFGIANPALTPSSTQASGHPDVTISFDRTGDPSEDLRDIRVDLPQGLLADPESANPKCTDAQFNTDACPSNSVVGSLSYKYTVAGFFGPFDVTVPGTIYMLEPAPDDTATVGFTLRPKRYCIWFFCANPQKIFQKTSVKLRADGTRDSMTLANYDAQRTVTTSVPLLFTAVEFDSEVTVKSVSVKLHSRSGATQEGDYFTLNSAACQPATTVISITSYQDVTATGESTFTPTGCDQVPFDPSIEFAAPTTTAGGKTSVSVFTLNVPDDPAPIQNSPVKSMEMILPKGSAPDFVELAKIQAKPTCEEADLQANTCPADSIIGLSAAYSKFLPPNLVGGVWKTGPVGLTIPGAARLVGPRGSSVIVRFTTGLRVNPQGEAELFATFDDGPQLPYYQFVLGLIPVYVNPQQCGDATTTAKLIGWSGAEVTRTHTYQVTDCPPPSTTITSGPPANTTDNTPTFAFNATIPGTQFFCKVDSEPEAPCTSPHTTAPLGLGQHTFSVYGKNGPTAGPPATRTFTVTAETGTITANYSLSTLQAAAHPDLTATLHVDGGQLRNLNVTMPRGLQASSTARPLCSLSDANAGNCPAASQVGTVSVTATVGGSPQTGVGAAYLIPGPTAADAGGIALEAPIAGGTLISLGGVSTIDNTNSQVLRFRDVPNTVNGSSIAITDVVLTVEGSVNGLLTNSSLCAASSWSTVAESWSGGTSGTITQPYQATNCAAVPFEPNVTRTYPAPPQAGSTTGVTVTVDVPLDHSTLSSVRVNEPPFLAPNFPAFGASTDQCPAASAPNPTSTFDETLCPPQARVGTMTIHTPLLAAPLVGSIHLISKSPIPWFGVAFDQPGVKLRLLGITSTPQVDPLCDPLFDPNGFCQTQISTLFVNLPTTPMTQTVFDITDPPRSTPGGTISSDLLRTAAPNDPICEPELDGTWTAISHSGVTRNGVQAIQLQGCN